MRTIVAIILILLTFTAAVYAGGYLWPMPFNHNNLSSLFGDWRSRRYHAGLDIRTGGVIGKVVVAPDDCTLWRVRTSWYGYGKALYLRLSDGRIAVFGHLSRFHPSIEAYAQDHQLAAESYYQDLFPKAEQFHFTRGDTIAWSGSTGVGAPHLHFEIRTADNEPINPLQLPGLEVSDTRPPTIRRLHLITGIDPDLAAALGVPTEYEFDRNAKTGVYELSAPLPVGVLPYWLSVEMYDYVGVNNWRKPVFKIELRQGEHQLYSFTHDTLDFAKNFQIDATRNYQRAMQGDKFYQNLVDSSMLAHAKGIGGLIDDYSQPLEIVATDVAGNSTRAQVYLTPDSTKLGIQPPFSQVDTGALQRLVRERGVQQGDLIGAFFPWNDSLLFVGYDTSEQSGYWELTDLRGRIVRPIDVGGGLHLAFVDSDLDQHTQIASRAISLRITSPNDKQSFATFATEFRPPTARADGKVSWSSPDGRFEMIAPPVSQTFFPLDRNGFFEIEPRDSGNVVDYAIVPEEFAARQEITYRYHFQVPLPRGAAIYQAFGDGSLSFVGAEVDPAAQTVSGYSYRLGVFTERIDTIPPTIASVSPRDGAQITVGRPEIKAKLEDTLSGIDQITIRLDGKWLIPEFDPESGWVRATPHFNLTLGKHRLDIIVTDKLGNEQRYSSGFTMVD